MTGIIQKVLAKLKMERSRVFAVAVLTVVLAFTVYQADAKLHTVRIREGDDVQIVLTMEESPGSILEQHGYQLGTYDTVEFTGFYAQMAEISITRAFPARVVCDGKKDVYMFTQGTVADLLEMAEITLGEDDLVDASLSKIVEENDTITVTRVETVTREEEVEIPFQTTVTTSPLLGSNVRKVLAEGEPGLQVKTYTQLIVDGVPEAETLVADEIIAKPVDADVMVGLSTQSVSPLDFGFDFDDNGEPEEYADVLRNQRAAGYSAPVGARTASGRPAVVGHVAVNPNVIPYGSKLYIRSTDGRFVYGYAVAADTGTALKNGVIAVDLFYGSYAESAMNGIKYVDIYILE